MARLALIVCLFVSASALARPEDCLSKCEDDKKNCEVQCGRKTDKKNAGMCRSACTELTDPCKDACNKRDRKKK